MPADRVPEQTGGGLFTNPQRNHEQTGTAYLFKSKSRGLFGKSARSDSGDDCK